MQATGQFTRRASSADEIRARLEAQRNEIAEAALGYTHDHEYMWHAKLVQHLNEEHGLSLPLTGIGTRDLTEAHDMAHEGGYSSGWALAAMLVSLVPMSLLLVFVARLAGAVGAVA